MTRLDVVCWKWRQRGYRSQFGAEQVNVLARMVARHYRRPHRFSCITDDAAGIDPAIRVIPLWDEFGALPNPSFTGGPSCYRRLKAFSAEARKIIGPRFVSLDLDCVVTGDLEPLLDRDADFIIWGDTLPGYWYNGSMWMMDAGARRQVYDRFDPLRSPAEANRAGRRGSDQGWISYCLGPGEQIWTKADGVYSFRNHLQPNGAQHLPNDARIVFFHGAHDPWGELAQKLPWVRRLYC